MNRKRLIYIIGAGRSGTTVLDIILGNLDDAISLGEINRYFKRQGTPPQRKSKDKTALFWLDFKANLENKNVKYSNCDANQKLLHRNEYHTALKTLWCKPSEEYSRMMCDFYDTLICQTTNSLIIESSKYPLRAFHLSNLATKTPFQVDFVYLKKDPLKVVKSFGKKGLEQPPKGFWAANVYYLIINILCTWVTNRLRKKGHKVCLLNYEELAESSTTALTRLGADLALDISKPLSLILNKHPLQTGVMFDGNRIRLKDNIIFAPVAAERKGKNLKELITRVINYIIYR